MNFFTKEEFAICECHPDIAEINASYANRKLAYEGEVVFGYVTEDDKGNEGPFRFYQTKTHPVLGACKEVTALVINIEPIKKCKHPEEKVKILQSGYGPAYENTFSGYTCECGAILKPSAFTEIDA